MRNHLRALKSIDPCIPESFERISKMSRMWIAEISARLIRVSVHVCLNVVKHVRYSFNVDAAKEFKMTPVTCFHSGWFLTSSKTVARPANVCSKFVHKIQKKTIGTGFANVSSLWTGPTRWTPLGFWRLLCRNRRFLNLITLHNWWSTWWARKCNWQWFRNSSCMVDEIPTGKLGQEEPYLQLIQILTCHQQWTTNLPLNRPLTTCTWISTQCNHERPRSWNVFLRVDKPCDRRIKSLIKCNKSVVANALLSVFLRQLESRVNKKQNEAPPLYLPNKKVHLEPKCFGAII